ncbi:MAG: RNA polymerase subunit sigma [Lachnospiraceae bacterium]|nr:RNA polymerase subunit sigma [Lachnospiraceae bacterium]
MLDEMTSKALLAKEDEAVFTELVEENRKFIKSAAYRAVHHFITESDDEWSVSLIAFHEAVMQYDESKGNFAAFAMLVIRRRLLDHMTSERRHMGEIAMEPMILEGNPEEMEDLTGVQSETLKKTAALSDESSAPGSSAIKDEIDSMQEVLSAYGFSFFDLAECSPKAGKTKDACAKLIRALTASPELMAEMRKNHALPIKELLKVVKVPRKIAERHRKYIIAAAEIIGGEYPLLTDYLAYIRKGMEDP